MSDKKINKFEHEIILDVFLKVFPLLVEKYPAGELQEATDKTIASLKSAIISLKTDSK